MGFKFNKRIKIGKGLGLNISKYGISSSLRTKRGSISSKGYSIRTGIPGLSYRKTFNKSKNSGCVLFVIFLLTLGLIIISCSSEGTSSPCRDTNCPNYTSQTAAQAAFDADP